MNSTAIAASSQANPEANPAASPRWVDGNRFELLENGEQYFPAVFAAIAKAQSEVLIETFILFEDAVGRELQRVLIAAARRGVSIDLTVDGYGSPDLSSSFIEALTDAGVRLHIFDPRPRIFGLRTNVFRRLHRKIVAIDNQCAFVGGINYAVDQLAEAIPAGKLDFAVRITGPLVLEIQQFARNQASLFGRRRHWWQRASRTTAYPHAAGKALFVVRDNDAHRDDIERHYRIAIRAASDEVVICNAYFFPGYRVLRQLRQAARRGVKVTLILQGAPDMPAARAWSTMLYAPLLQAGVEIYEYCRQPLHCKVAVVDDEWSTIGSSNLDPLSLALNLEANVVIRDRGFNRELRARMQRVLHEHCQRIDPATVMRRKPWHIVLHTLAYHCTRHFPLWAGWLPAHVPRLHSVTPHKPREQSSSLLDARSSQ